jgi:hypothetical protein
MSRCAVVVGVNKTGELPVLHAAASGAREFAAWATSQGIEVTLLTDDNASVSLGDVNSAIRNYVQQRTYSQLIVFFSGHGILRAPDYELWLLSGAPDDPNDAVNVPGSIWLARNVGIPHVVIVSDACRSRPNTSRLSQIQGGVIFPNESPRTPRPAVDVFYAALPGDPALEVSAKDATENYRGIFTECLLKGLRGEVPDLIVNIGHSNLNEEKWVIPSWQLKPYLEEEVPDAAANVHIKLQQDPDIRVESHPPNYFADANAPSPRSRAREARPSQTNKVTFRHVTQSLKQDRYFQGHVQDGTLPPNTREVAEKSEMAHAIDRLLSIRGRESFETRTGFSVIGGKIDRAVITGSGCDVFEESGAYQVRVHNDGEQSEGRSALIQLNGDIGVPLAVLPGFIGTIVVEHDRVVTVTYLPSRYTPKYDEYQHVASEVERRRAFVAVAARNGSFRLEGGIEALEGAQFLRTLKAIDPTLGLYSAYAYAQAGDLEGLASVFEYMSREREPILFDVAMLTNRLARAARTTTHSLPISPFCPMLTQGWALVEPNEMWLPAPVRHAREHLLPGLWTTFSPEGVAQLWSPIENGSLA